MRILHEYKCKHKKWARRPAPSTADMPPHETHDGGGAVIATLSSLETLVADLERSFINSGRVRVVASAEEREGVRAERQDQQQYASEETMKSWGRERGADFMLLGEVNAVFDREENREVKYYQVDCYLVDLEDNTKVWTGFEKIKKFVGRSKYKP